MGREKLCYFRVDPGSRRRALRHGNPSLPAFPQARGPIARRDDGGQRQGRTADLRFSEVLSRLVTLFPGRIIDPVHPHCCWPSGLHGNFSHRAVAYVRTDRRIRTADLLCQRGGFQCAERPVLRERWPASGGFSSRISDGSGSQVDSGYRARRRPCVFQDGRRLADERMPGVIDPGQLRRDGSG
jgi:hypothetical protein